MPVNVNTENCDGCGMCLNSCLSGAISIVRGKTVINDDFCISCGECSLACPNGAISESKILRHTIPVHGAGIFYIVSTSS